MLPERRRGTLAGVTPEPAAILGGIDTTRPNVARVYDYWLSGKDNFASDRELARKMLGYDPGLPGRAQANRAFVTAVTRRAAEAGIRQFLDVGAGLPTHPAVHEAARDVVPDAVVVYVDNDPVVISHARALLAKGDGLDTVPADLRDPDAVLASQSLISLDEPVCVLLAGVTHFLPAEVARDITARYMALLSAGSWLALSVAYYEDAELLTTLISLYTAGTFFNHSAKAVQSFTDGLDLLSPGIAEARRWISGTAGWPPDEPGYMLCAAAVKR
jgi:O-methyltransferase involved in polyketide biosynthesis